MKKVSWIVWICIVIIIVSATMIILYFNKTWSPHLSSDAGDWSDFGGFLSPLVSLITMIILLITIQENKGIEERNLVINKKEELGEAVIILYQLLPVFFAEYGIYDDLCRFTLAYGKEISRLKELEKRTEEDLAMGVDDENIEDEAKLREMKMDIQKLQTLIEKDVMTMKEYENSLENRNREIYDAMSRVELYTQLYFANEIGLNIVTYATYSMTLYHNSKHFSKIIEPKRAQFFATMKRNSLEEVFKLGEKIDNSMNKDVMESKMSGIMKNINFEDEFKVLDFIAKQEREDKKILAEE